MINAMDLFIDMDDKVEQVKSLLNLESNDCHIVGIHGLEGIGKTTLAKLIFNKLSSRFDSCSFLENVREELQSGRLLKLQQQLYKDIIGLKSIAHITNRYGGMKKVRATLGIKKVLLVIDDMNDAKQLTELIGHQVCFASGSRIIVTTRKKEILNDLMKMKEVFVYELKELENHQALKLFSKSCFRMDHPPVEYESFSKEVISYTKGLPLALKIIGSLLAGMKKEAWKNKLEELRTIPKDEIKMKLMIGYDVLNIDQQQIFLNIANYPSNLNKAHACYMWEDHGWHPHEAIDVLLNLSLIDVVQNPWDEHEYLQMHNVLKDLGRDIVQERSKRCGRFPSKLEINDNLDILQKIEGKAYVETPGIFAPTIASQDMVGLDNWEFLILSVQEVKGNFHGNFSDVRWLHCFNAHEFRATNLNLKNLLIFDLSFSKITPNWEGWSTIKASKLKVLDLSYCYNMTKTPCLKNFSSLEVLVLDECVNLIEIDNSISELKNLARLSMQNCYSLWCLPSEGGFSKALKEIIAITNNVVFQCFSFGLLYSFGRLENPSNFEMKDMDRSFETTIGKLESLHELDLSKTGINGSMDWIRGLKYLYKLNLSETNIIELPSSIGDLKELKVIHMNHCRFLRRFPSAIGGLVKLQELRATKCYKLEGEIPSEISLLSSLTILDLRDTPIHKVPELPLSLKHLFVNSKRYGMQIHWGNHFRLTNIIELELSCLCQGPNLEEYDNFSFEWIRTTKNLQKLSLRIPYFVTGVEQMDELSSLKHLELSFVKFQYPPNLPSSLLHLKLNQCEFLSGILDVSNLNNMKYLGILSPNKLIKIEGLGQLYSLEELFFYGLDYSENVEGLVQQKCLKKLRTFSLTSCGNLKNLRGMPELECLEYFKLSCCFKLNDIYIRGGLKNLKELEIFYCDSLKELPNLSSFNRLSSLTLWLCKNMVSIVSFKGLESLKSLIINVCPSLEDLPDISILGKLRNLEIRECDRLGYIKGIPEVETLEHVKIQCCNSLELSTPDLSKLKGIRSLLIRNCKRLPNIHKP